MGTDYVHGYTPSETRRLRDQAGTLADLLHGGTTYQPGARVLEAGCGVGAQTVQLVTRNPGIDLVAVDRSEESLARAKTAVAAVAPDARVDWRQADLLDLPFAPGGFDHIFVCFVLEHLADPVGALAALQPLLRPSGTITVIEGDHGTAVYHPPNAAAGAVIGCLIELQAATGGDALIGRRLQPLVTAAGYDVLEAGARTVYADQTLPRLVDGFTRKTFIAMVESVHEQAIAAGLRTRQEWEEGVRALERTAEPGGTFSYTFTKVVARR